MSIVEMMRYDDLVGVPFVDGGRTRDGLDCWGLAMILLKRQGYSVSDYPICATAVQEIAEALKDGSECGSYEHLDSPEYGCIVLLRLSMDVWANHVGICIGHGRFIHAYSKTGVCIDRLSRWKSRIVGYYRPGRLES